MYNLKTYCRSVKYDKINLKATTAGSGNRPGHRGAATLYEDKVFRHVPYHGGCFIGVCRQCAMYFLNTFITLMVEWYLLTKS